MEEIIVRCTGEGKKWTDPGMYARIRTVSCLLSRFSPKREVAGRGIDTSDLGRGRRRGPIDIHNSDMDASVRVHGSRRARAPSRWDIAERHCTGRAGRLLPAIRDERDGGTPKAHRGVVRGQRAQRVRYLPRIAAPEWTAQEDIDR